MNLENKGLSVNLYFLNFWSALEERPSHLWPEFFETII